MLIAGERGYRGARGYRRRRMISSAVMTLQKWLARIGSHGVCPGTREYATGEERGEDAVRSRRRGPQAGCDGVPHVVRQPECLVDFLGRRFFDVAWISVAPRILRQGRRVPEHLFEEPSTSRQF